MHKLWFAATLTGLLIGLIAFGIHLASIPVRRQSIWQLLYTTSNSWLIFAVFGYTVAVFAAALLVYYWLGYQSNLFCLTEKRRFQAVRISRILFALFMLFDLIIFFVSNLQKGTVMANFEVHFQKDMNTFGNNTATSWRVQNIQSSLKCCGVKGPTDYKHQSVDDEIQRVYVPSSCCGDASQWKSTNSVALLCIRGKAKYGNGCQSRIGTLYYLPIQLAIGSIFVLQLVFAILVLLSEWKEKCSFNCELAFRVREDREKEEGEMVNCERNNCILSVPKPTIEDVCHELPCESYNNTLPICPRFPRQIEYY